jgi:hypothetical protein
LYQKPEYMFVWKKEVYLKPLIFSYCR